MQTSHAPYEPDAFQARIDYAVQCILRDSWENNRSFDTCFEMFDGEYVAEGVQRRAEKNERLKGLLGKVFNLSHPQWATRPFAALSREQLVIAAREHRQAAELRAFGRLSGTPAA